MAQPAPAVVYRVYDATERLIYIGATTNLTQRLVHHRSQAWWWSLAARIAHEPHEDMAAAFVAETAAIRTERPAFNLVANRGRPTRFQHRLTADDLQVCRDWFYSKPRGGSLPMPLLRLVRSSAGIEVAA